MSNHITNISEKMRNTDIKVEIKRIGHTIADNIIPAIRIWS